MQATVYNASIGGGVALMSIGAGAQFGWPVGLMTAGALVISLAIVTLRTITGGR